MYSQHKWEWIGGSRRPAWLQINSLSICYPLSLHKHVGDWGDETTTRFWHDLVVMEGWCFLSTEGNLAPVKIFIFTMTTAANCFVHWCHLTLTEAHLFVVSMLTWISSLEVADNLPHWVSVILQLETVPTWWSPPPIRLHWVNMDNHQNVIRNRCKNRLPNQNRLSY